MKRYNATNLSELSNKQLIDIIISLQKENESYESIFSKMPSYKEIESVKDKIVSLVGNLDDFKKGIGDMFKF